MRWQVMVVLLAVAAGCQSRSFDLPPSVLPTGGSSGSDGPGFQLDVGTAPDVGEAGASGDGVGGVDAGMVPDLNVGPDACPAGADFSGDPANCGACGNVCSFPNALAACAGGKCVRGDCLPGSLDLNQQPLDGCEYACTVSNEGQELCDDRDNDCDGEVDEATAKQTDLDNCGACGNRCAFLNGGASCSAGQCRLGTCADGWKNANGMEADGCECAQSNGGIEVCDGFDNDCNGMVDDVADRNFENDPQNCGGCRINCTVLPHANGTCRGNSCAVLACEIGHHDQDGNVMNGCEISCPGGSPGSPEVCDGIDNDCDGKLDAADDDLQAVSNFCAARGECAGTVPRCTGGQWLCEYGAGVQTVGPNQIIGNESWCDGKDNDCDGCVDETFPQVGRKPAATGGSCAESPPATCTDGGKGACQGRGVYACTPDKLGVACTITTPGAAPVTEVCDGQDNNCDGVIDNGDAADPNRVREPMVAISGGGLAGTVYMYAYEASRPDASAASGGQSGARACARAGVMPWTNVSHPEAVAACAAAGKRLCTEAEWQRACETPASPACTWSFATTCTTAATGVCNSYEHDGDPATAGDQDRALATGALAMCHARWSDTDRIFDLSGNVREWTAARGAATNPVRGGAYDAVLSGATCGFSFAVFDDRFRHNNTGFRCCADAP
jgi:hypothetical protein